jgi:Predicted ICC-like phosphoesterases
MAKAEGALTITLGAVPVTLLPDRAVLWEDTIFVADVHLEKAAFFQREGFPVPEGSDQDDLARLDALLTAHSARRLVVLGDFFHRPPRPGGTLDRALHHWLTEQQARGRTVHGVRGNHDRERPSWSPTYPIAWAPAPWPCGPLLCVHEPEEAKGLKPEQPWLAGHLHPGYRMKGLRKEQLYGPVFWQQGNGLILPAFGSLTGTVPVTPARGDALYLLQGGGIYPVPSPRSA